MKKISQVLLIALLAVSVVSAGPSGIWVAQFSVLEVGSLLSGWSPWEFSKIPQQTEYTLAVDDGRTVLRAKSQLGASALIKDIEIDLDRYPIISWSWKTDGPFEGGDWIRRETDDFPLRVFIIFESKKGPFSFLKNLANDFSGKEAINYVWSQGSDPEKKGDSPATSRVQMIALKKEQGDVGNWVSETRNVVADYQLLFGKQPEKVVAIALMTDTDDTRSECVSYFGDICFAVR